MPHLLHYMTTDAFFVWTSLVFTVITAFALFALGTVEEEFRHKAEGLRAFCILIIAIVSIVLLWRWSGRYNCHFLAMFSQVQTWLELLAIFLVSVVVFLLGEQSTRDKARQARLKMTVSDRVILTLKESFGLRTLTQRTKLSRIYPRTKPSLGTGPKQVSRCLEEEFRWIEIPPGMVEGCRDLGSLIQHIEKARPLTINPVFAATVPIMAGRWEK